MKALDHEIVDLVLDRLRRERNWTWAEFARRAELEPPNLAGLRAGNRPLTPAVMAKLAKGLKSDPGELYAEIAAETIRQKTEDVSKANRNIWAAGDAYSDCFRQQIETLGEGDEYVLVTSERPIEITDTRLRDILIEAAQKGVELFYLFPKFSSKTEKLSPQFVPIAVQLGAFALEEQFKLWCESLRHRLKSLGLQTNVVDHFHGQTTTRAVDLFFFAPFVNYLLLRRRVGRSSVDAWIEVHYDCDQFQRRCFVKLRREAAELLSTWYEGVRSGR